MKRLLPLRSSAVVLQNRQKCSGKCTDTAASVGSSLKGHAVGEGFVVVFVPDGPVAKPVPDLVDHKAGLKHLLERATFSISRRTFLPSYASNPSTLPGEVLMSNATQASNIHESCNTLFFFFFCRSIASSVCGF